MLKKYFISLGLLFFSCSLIASEYWIDVRIPEQYRAQRLEGAINLPLSELREKIGRVAKNKDDTIYLYCNSGRQSAIARNILHEMGYSNVTDAGGFENAQGLKLRNALLNDEQLETTAHTEKAQNSQ